MGVLRQFGQLLWKNFILRKREPHVLVLEILWPLLIFIIVALIRYGAPPNERSTCSYQERAMPSSGMFPFLQSTACNLQNTCEEPSSIESKQQSASRLAALVSDLEPYLSDPKTVAAMKTVNVSVKVVKGLQELTANNTLDEIIGDLDGFTVKKFFRDPDKVYKLFVSDLKIMTPAVANALLNSTVNVISLMNLFGGVNFKTIACNEDLLKQYMVFRKDVNVAQVSKELCAIDNDNISAITDVIQTQLDVAAIIRMAKSLTTLTNSYELADAMEDMATMADLFYDSPMIGGMMKMMNIDLPSVMSKLPTWIDTMTKMQTIDTSSIDAVMELLKPMADNMFNDSQWKSTEQVIAEIKDIIEAVGSGDNANWTAVLQKGLKLVELLEGDMNLELIKRFARLPIEEMTNITTALFSGNTEMLQNMSAEKTMMFVQMMVEQILDKNTTMTMLAVTNGAMDTGVLVLSYLNDMDRSVEQMLKENGHLLNAFVAFYKMGPDVITGMWNLLFGTDFFMDLFKNPLDEAKCRALIQQGMGYLGNAVVSDLQKIVCNANVTMAINQMVDLFNVTDLQRKIEMSIGAIDKILKGHLPQPPVTMLTVYQKYLTLSQLFDYLIKHSMNARWIYSTHLHMNKTAIEWNPLMSSLGSSVLQGSWPSMMVMIGSAIENTTMWKTVGPYFRSMDVVMDYMINQMEVMQDMVNESSTMGKLTKYATEYSAEIMTALMSMDANMMQKIMTTPDPIVLLCDQKILSQMGMPSYVPVADMESMICTTNWTQVIMDISSAYNMEPMMQQIREIFEDKSTTVAPFDWDGMVSDSQKLMNMMQDQEKLTSMMTKMNFTKIQEAFASAMAKMGNMQSYDITAALVGTMSQMDASMKNETAWKAMKYYVKLYDAYLKFYTKILKRNNGTVDINQMLSNISKTFEEFISKSAATMPDFLTALKTSSADPFMLVMKMISKMNMTNLCQGNVLADIFGVSSSSGLAQYEQHLCNLNWTAVVMEMMQSDADLRKYIELQIIISTTPMNKWPDLSVNWTEVVMTAQHYMEVMSSYQIQKVTFSSLDVKKLNMTWESLIQSLTSLQNMDKFGQQFDSFYSLMKMFPKSGNESDILTEMEIMGAMLQYQSYHVMHFMVIHLSYINSTGYLNLKTYLKSDEFNKILDNIAASPDISATGLQTMVDMMSDMNKANQIIQSWDKMCSNLTVFTSIISAPPDRTVDLGTLQQGICGLNLNFTKLIMELSNSLKGFPEVLQAMTMDVKRFDMDTMYVNQTTIQKETEKVQLLFQHLIMKPPTILLGVSESWMNFTIYEQQWNAFLQKMSTSFSPANMAMMQNQGLTMALSGLNAIPEFSSILQYISLSVTLSINQYNRTLAGFQDPLAVYNGYPNLQKLMKLADDIPHLYVAWAFNSIYNPSKIMTVVMQTSWEGFCGLTAAALPDNLPGSTFNVATFHGQLCGINMTALMTEASHFQGTEQFQKLLSTNITKPVDLAKLSAQITEFTNMMMSSANSTHLNNMVVPAYLNMTVWETAYAQLNAAISDPQRLMELSTRLTQFAGSLLNQNVSMPIDMTFYATMYGIIEVALDKLDMLSNHTILDIDELLAKDPETKKLWAILQKPGFLETLLNSANTPKFSQLFTKTNITEVLMLLCHPVTGDLGAYLTVPSHVSLNLTELKTEFCNVDIAKLPQEFMEEISQVMSQMSDNTTNFNWTLVAAQNLRLQEWISRWSATPPTIKLPMAWQNMSFWIDMLTKYSQANMIDPSKTEDIWKIMQMFSALQAAVNQTSEWKFVNDFLSTGKVIIDTVNKLLMQVIAQGSKLDLAMLLKDSATLKNLLTSTGKISEDVVKGLFSGYLKPGKISDFLMMIETGKLPELICNEDKVKDMFSFPASFNVTSMVKAVCDLNNTDIMKELVNQLELEPLITKLMSNMSSQAVDMKSLLTAVQQLSDKMMQVMNISSVTFSWLNLDSYADFNVTKFNTLLMQELQNYQHLQVSVFDELQELLFQNSTDVKRIVIAFSLFSSWSKSLLTTISANLDKPVSFAALFGNSTLGSALSDLYSNPVWIEELMQVQVDAQQLMSVLSSMNVTQVMCSQRFYDIFTMPSNATVLPELQKSFCKPNQPPILYDMMSILLIDHNMYLQLQALFDENALGSMALNFSKMYKDSEEASAALTALLEKVFQKSNMTSLFNTTEFIDFFTKLGQLLSQQYTQQLSSWIPMLSDSLGQVMDPTYNKMVHTINVFVKYITSRLVHLTDTVSLNTLFGNATHIVQVMEAYLNIQKHQMSVFSKDFSFEKLMKLSTTPALVQELCKTKTLASYLSVGNQTLDLAKDYETIMCLDHMAFLNALDDQMGVNYLTMQLNKIWNSTIVPPVNWTEFNGNMNNLTSLMTGLLQKLPVLDKDLMALLDFNLTMNSITMFMDDPELIWRILSAYPMEVFKIDTSSISDFIGYWTQMYPAVMKVLKEAQGAGNSSTMNDLWKSLETLNAKLSSMGASYYKALFEKLSTYAEVRSVVCNTTTLTMYMSSETAQNVSMALCGQPGNTWYDRLMQKNIEVKILIDSLKAASGVSMSPKITWKEFVKQLQDLTQILQSLNSNQVDKLVQMMLTSMSNANQANVASTMKWLMLLGNNTMPSAQGYLNLLVEINKYLNYQLNVASKHGGVIPVTVLLPNNTEVVKILENSLGHGTAAVLLTANMNPLKFLEFSISSRYVTVVCNITYFKEVFLFPAGTDLDRVQKDLCADAQRQDSAVAAIMHSLNAADVMKAFDDLMKGNTQVTHNEKDLWEAINKHTTQFIQNLEKMQNITLDMAGFENWVQPIIQAMQTLNTQSLTTIGQTCDRFFSYISNTGMYKMEWGPALQNMYHTMKLAKRQMQLQMVIEKSICDMDNMNLTTLLQMLKEGNITQLIAGYLMQENSTMAPFMCSEYAALATEISAMYNASLYRYMTDPTRYSRCMKNGLKIPLTLLTDTAQTFKLAGQLLEMLSDPAIQSLAQNSEILSIIELALKAYIEQSKVALKLSDLMKNITDVNQFLGGVLQLTPEMINVLLNSTLKFDGMSLFNQSSASIQAVICDPDKLSKVITLPAFSKVTVANISSMLCSLDISSSADTLKSLIDISSLTMMISQADTGDMTWWNLMSAHLTKVFQNIQELYKFSEFKIDINNLNALLPLIQRLVYDSGPDVLAQSIVVLMEDFKRLSNDTETQQLLTDFQKIVAGMTSLKVIRNFIPVNVVLGDVVKDKGAMRKYMMNDLGFSKEVTDALLTGSVAYDKLIKYPPENLQDRLCNVTQLKEILNMTSNNANLTDVSSALCNLSEAHIVNLTNSLLENLNIGSLIEKYITSGLDAFTNKFNISSAEAKDSLEKLSAAQEDLKAAANLFSNKSKELNLNVFNSPQALQGVDSLSSLSSLICGSGSSSDSFALSDSSGVSSKMSNVDKLDEDQVKEMKELPGAFCQDLYADIASTREGAVIWTYLKPLLRGKILFSPDTPATRRLTEIMNNKSFAILSDVRTYAKDWASGLYEISDLKSNDQVLEEVKKLSSSAAVSGFLQSILGVTSEDVAKGFDTLDSFDKKELNQMKNLADMVYKYTGCLESDRFKAMATEEDLLKEALKLGKSGQYLAGVVFTGLESGNRKKRAASTSLPKHVSYKIRMDIENVRHTNRIKGRMWVPDPDDDMVFEMRYLRGFSQLQDMVEQAIIQMQTGRTSGLPTVNLQQFPTFCHRHDVYLTYLAMYLLPVLMTFAWLASMAVSAKNLVYDREHAQEETLKIMGMRSYLNWWAWFLVTMAVMAISALISVGALRIGKMFLYTNFGIMFLYFLTFCFSCTMMCYMVSAFFTRTTLAVLTVLIVYLLSYLPYIVLISLNAQMLTWHKILVCLSSTTAFAFGAQYLARYEVTMTGVQWHNIDKSPVEGDDLSFSWMCYMMLIDAAIYLFIGWYVRNVKPGKYGVSQPWYFPVCPWYWGCVGKSSSANKYAPSREAPFTESVPSNFVVGMSLRNLSKTYGKQKVVQNLSVDLYEGQITALLGHNGAAKTTTINMLAGILEPTEGNVTMYGRSLSNSSHMIGFCSQHDALFHYMTVLEHMKFYGSVKSNQSKEDQDYEIQQLLKDVDLWHVQDSRVGELSGGMRRRLSVALAFVGGSSIIILDEPTSGVDPHGRRCIWNLIQKRKNRCTVLLSTHHLDEADMIGDRVAVMHRGQLMCCGSPLYLKQKLGSGYHLKLDKQDNKCDVGRVMSTVQSWIPGAELTEDIGSEITILLPVQFDTMDRLYKCLHDLDLNSATLGVSNYGIFDTTMEEVFMKVCDICDNNLPLTVETVKSHSGKPVEGKMIVYQGEKNNRSQESTLEMTGPRHDPRERVSSGSQKLQQFSALTVKRFHHYRRNWKMFLSIFVLPLIFVAAALGFMTIRPDDTQAPSLMLTPAMYGPNSYTFFKDSAGDVMSNQMVNHIVASPGMSTTCMSGMKPGSPYVCKKSGSAFYTPDDQRTSQANCTCESYKYVCVTPPTATAVPQVITETTEILLDLNGHDVTQYLLNTYDKFKLVRYGGWTFNKDGTSTKALVWFNNRGHHAMPAFYNAYSNALLRSLVPDYEAAEYGITAYNHPVMMHKEQLTQDTILQSAADLGIAAVLLTALTFLPVGFMIYVVSEYKNKERQLEFVSGVGVFLYWFTSLIWDLFMYCITTGLIIAIMAIFQQSTYWARENLAGSVVLILLYGWAMIPGMYCTAKFFRDSTSAYMVLFCSSVFVGIITIAIIFILDFFSSTQGVKDAYDVIKYVFLIFPQYSLAEGFIQLTANQIQSEILARFGEDVYVSPFHFDLLLWNYVAMAIVGFVAIVLLFIMEIRCSIRKSLPADAEEDLCHDSEEVNNEKQRVLTGYAGDDVLIVNKLSKVYTRNKKDFLAVNRASFGVPKGECFGLLGVNGAGKTTTFRMLTGDILPSDGTAFINHRKIGQASVNMGRNVGYCPQENALDLYLTGRELLYCHAKLRGIPSKCRKTAVETLIQKLKLEYADRTIHTYSGGMKRKLSAAVALLGEPSIVFLDEPTTGMDPAAKRLVWDCILEAVRNQQSVILTSHSMEECDMLCTRLAIMVNGEFCCLGSPQFLKHKYGDGYTVVLHISGLSTIKYAISEFINIHFPQAVIREQHFSALQLDIPKASTSVTNIIKCLEEEKENLGITHYSVSQTTLDNVFLNFARDQTDGTDGSDLSSGSGGSDKDSLTHISEPFTNPTYAYMNPDYKTDDENLGSKSSSFLVSSPKQIIPDLSTKL